MLKITYTPDADLRPYEPVDSVTFEILDGLSLKDLTCTLSKLLVCMGYGPDGLNDFINTDPDDNIV